MTTSQTSATTAIAVLIGAALAVAGSDGSTTLARVPLFAWCIGTAFAINWVAFIPSHLRRTERLFDLTGSLTYLSIIALMLLGHPDPSARSVVLAVLVAVWAVRLGSFLFMRISREGADGRFDELKTSGHRFLMTWTLQALWVSLTVGAAVGAGVAEEEQRIGVLGAIGISVWVVGFVFELVADRQKQRFRSDPANRGAYLTTGLWAWCRHPNYFGEIVLWLGVAIVAIPQLDGWRYATLISPVFVALLLTRISGVPLQAARARKRWGDDPGFRRYLESTPMLIPRRPRRA